MNANPMAVTGPLGHRRAGQPGPVVTTQHSGVTAVAGQPVELIDQNIGGDAAFNQPAQAFPSVLINDRHDLDRAPVGGGVELKVHRPHPIGRIGNHDLGRGAGAEAFAAAALRHPQTLLAPQSLQAFVVDIPAVGAGAVIGAAKPPAGMLFGPQAQPRPQSSIRVARRLAGRAVTLGGAVLPGDPAGEPLTDLHHPHQVVHSGAPALRA